MITPGHCPFCGNVSIQVIKTYLDNGKAFYRGWCSKCGTCGPVHIDCGEAVSLWNERRIKVEEVNNEIRHYAEMGTLLDDFFKDRD